MQQREIFRRKKARGRRRIVCTSSLCNALPAEKIRWMVIIHLVFVISGVLLALMDWLAAKVDKH